MELITCTQCKRTLPEDSFRLLRGERKKQRGRQKLCKDCERLNRVFRRKYDNYMANPSEENRNELDKYLEWYKAIIERDGGPYKARIPNKAREALGYTSPEQTVDSMISIDQITQITKMQINSAQHGIDAVPKSVSTKGSEDENPKEIIEEALSGMLFSKGDSYNLYNTIRDMLHDLQSRVPQKDVYTQERMDTLESIAYRLDTYGDINGDLQGNESLIDCLDTALGALQKVLNTDNNGCRDESIREVLDYLQAVLFEM